MRILLIEPSLDLQYDISRIMTQYSTEDQLIILEWDQESPNLESLLMQIQQSEFDILIINIDTPEFEKIRHKLVEIHPYSQPILIGMSERATEIQNMHMGLPAGFQNVIQLPIETQEFQHHLHKARVQHHFSLEI